MRDSWARDGGGGGETKRKPGGAGYRVLRRVQEVCRYPELRVSMSRDMYVPTSLRSIPWMYEITSRSYVHKYLMYLLG